MLPCLCLIGTQNLQQYKVTLARDKVKGNRQMVNRFPGLCMKISCQKNKESTDIGTKKNPLYAAGV